MNETVSDPAVPEQPVDPETGELGTPLPDTRPPEEREREEREERERNADPESEPEAEPAESDEGENAA